MPTGASISSFFIPAGKCKKISFMYLHGCWTDAGASPQDKKNFSKIFETCIPFQKSIKHIVRLCILEYILAMLFHACETYQRRRFTLLLSKRRRQSWSASIPNARHAGGGSADATATLLFQIQSRIGRRGGKIHFCEKGQQCLLLEKNEALKKMWKWFVCSIYGSYKTNQVFFDRTNIQVTAPKRGPATMLTHNSPNCWPKNLFYKEVSAFVCLFLRLPFWRGNPRYAYKLAFSSECRQWREWGGERDYPMRKTSPSRAASSVV